MDSKASTFTAAESKLLLICFKHMEGMPNIDWEAVATEYGYKDGGLARAKFNIAKGKCRSVLSGSNTTSKVLTGGNKPLDAKINKPKPCGVIKRGRGRPPFKVIKITAATTESKNYGKEKNMKTEETGQSERSSDGDKEMVGNDYINRFHPINEPHTDSEEEL